MGGKRYCVILAIFCGVQLKIRGALSSWFKVRLVLEKALFSLNVKN
jgi:hypothetical protein